jgi:hypothetical protein
MSREISQVDSRPCKALTFGSWDKETFGSPYTTPKKRKLSHFTATPKSGSNDSDFEGESEPDDDEDIKEEDASDGEAFSPTPARGRKARTKIQESFAPERRALLKLKVSK